MLRTGYANALLLLTLNLLPRTPDGLRYQLLIVNRLPSSLCAFVPLWFITSSLCAFVPLWFITSSFFLLPSSLLFHFDKGATVDADRAL